MNWSLPAYEVLVRNGRMDGKTRKTTPAVYGWPWEEKEAVDRTFCRSRFRCGCGIGAGLLADSHKQPLAYILRQSYSVHDILSSSFQTHGNVPVLIISLASGLLPKFCIPPLPTHST